MLQLKESKIQVYFLILLTNKLLNSLLRNLNFKNVLYLPRTKLKMSISPQHRSHNDMCTSVFCNSMYSLGHGAGSEIDVVFWYRLPLWFTRHEYFLKEMYGILTPFYFPGTIWLICFLYLLECSDAVPYTVPCWQQHFIVWNSIELPVASLYF